MFLWLTSLDLPYWVIGVGIMVVCFILAPIPYIIIDARAKRRTSNQLIGIINVLHERFVAVEEGVARNSEDIARLDDRTVQILHALQEMQKFNSDLLKVIIELQSDLRDKAQDDA